ncbi:MAG: hypothetical protein F6K14_33415 [Symploca sp. SIO2C1]|nr:hypothetical protein [Symploca sp. SIO2C1]
MSVRRQKAGGRRQEAEGRRQDAEGRRQEVGGKKACAVSFFSFFTDRLFPLNLEFLILIT